MSWYASRLCAPVNAREDFRNGAVETCTLILASEPEPNTRDWMDWFRTKTHAEDVLRILKV
jgi:hypothetical protein